MKKSTPACQTRRLFTRLESYHTALIGLGEESGRFQGPMLSFKLIQDGRLEHEDGCAICEGMLDSRAEGTCPS
jgi:hypothetical protein